MKAKTVITVVLLLFVVSSVAYLVVKELPLGSQAAPAEDDVPPAAAPTDEPPSQSADLKVVVYYFHSTARCPTCRKFESYSDELIRQEFAQQLSDGRLEWRVVNVDEPGNKHFVTDYKLYTKSIVLVKDQPGKPPQWKNLEKIWQLVHDKQAFVKYIKDEIAQYLRAD
ncbi:MAG: nitrophenyl compound nitroreductase subunit ArsF family protein [Planctomycetota bacterium]|jgi:hypothetical protein